MGNNIKATSLGLLKVDLSFDKKVSISVDTVAVDNSADFKVLIQIEPPSILNILDKIITNKDKFDLILAWNPKVLKSCSNSELFPFGTCWIGETDMSVHEKSKLLSIIASSKKMTNGHRLRHQIIKQKVTPMDVFGHGYNPIDNKIIGLKDYRFSLIVENEDTDNWFTEKLIDCLVTGTVPVHWGCRNIGNYFNTDGFIKFNTIDEFNSIAPTLTNERYKEMLPFINENFKISLNYISFHERVKSAIKNKLL